MLFTAVAVLNSCNRIDDQVVSEITTKVESMKYVLPDGKSVTVTFNKETGIPIQTKDFKEFKSFIDANREYATFIDKLGNYNLVKDKEELNTKLKNESEESLSKGVIGLQCSGYVNLISNVGSTFDSFVTTNQIKLIIGTQISPSTKLLNTSSMFSEMFRSYSIFSAVYQGNTLQVPSISQTSQIKIKNCNVDILFRDYHKESSFPYKTVTDYYYHSFGTNYEHTINSSFYINSTGRFARFSNGNLLQLGYSGNCYSITN